MSFLSPSFMDDPLSQALFSSGEFDHCWDELFPTDAEFPDSLLAAASKNDSDSVVGTSLTDDGYCRGVCNSYCYSCHAPVRKDCMLSAAPLAMLRPLTQPGAACWSNNPTVVSADNRNYFQATDSEQCDIELSQLVDIDAVMGYFGRPRGFSAGGVAAFGCGGGEEEDVFQMNYTPVGCGMVATEIGGCTGGTNPKREATSDYDASSASSPSVQSSVSDDDCEIDVESFSDATSSDSGRPLHPSHASLGGAPAGARLRVMPAMSRSAHVAAMHSYSSPPPSVRSPTVAAVIRSITSVSGGKSTSSRNSGGSGGVFVLRGIKRCGNVSRRYRRDERPRAGTRMAAGSRKPRRHADPPPQAGSSDSDCDKRAQHNVLERKRRNNLKEFFAQLRDAVPSLRVEPRSSKVVILQRARDCINEFRLAERQQFVERARQLRVGEELRRQLERLNAVAV